MEINFQSAKPTHRAMAMGIDIFVLLLLQAIFGTATVYCYNWFCHRLGFRPEADLHDWIHQMTGIFLFFGYFSISVGVFGNSVGKYYLNILAVDKFGNPLTMRKSYIRSVAYLLSSWTYFIGFLLPFFRKDRLALHDLVCETKVVDLENEIEVQTQNTQLSFDFEASKMSQIEQNENPIKQAS